MELRKCECGKVPYTQEGYDSVEGRTIAFVVCAFCHSMTEEYASADQAMQAWNEGKVE